MDNLGPYYFPRIKTIAEEVLPACSRRIGDFGIVGRFLLGDSFGICHDSGRQTNPKRTGKNELLRQDMHPFKYYREVFQTPLNASS